MKGLPVGRIEDVVETLFEHAPAGMAVVDPDFRYVRVNECLAAMNGRPAADHIGRTVREVVPDLWPMIEPMYAAVLRGDPSPEREFSGPSPEGGGRQCHWRVSCFPVRQGGAVAGVGVIVNDITDRRELADALASRSDLYAMLSRASRAVSERRTVEELYRDVCRIAVEQGRFRYAWIGVPDGDRLRPVASAGDDAGYMDGLVISLDEHDPRSQGPTGRAARLGQFFVVNDFIHSAITAPWHERARRAGFAASAAFPFTERGRIAAVLTIYAGRPGFFTSELVATLSEIMPIVSFGLDAFLQERERQRDDEALRLRDRAIHAASQGITIADARSPDMPIIFASEGFERMTGYRMAEVVGRNCRFLQGQATDVAAVAEIGRALRERSGCTVELVNYRKDGTPFWNELTLAPVVDDAGTLTHYVGVQADVTARHRLEQQVRQTQKMEAVGQLASGVAHDFNNLLTVIDGCARLLVEELPPTGEARELVTEIHQAAERAATLTRQLLAFSRKQVVAPRALDLNTLVRESERMLGRLLGEDVLLSTQLRTPLWPVRADPGQVEQVLVNLAVNARDAMPSGGRLSISTGMLTLPEGAGEVPPGEYVTLEVTDTGSGMDATTLARIFEPFFTTKLAGKGTGLGLATVRSIVEQSSGYIAVESRLGVGSTFRVLLPRAASGAEPAPAPLRPDAMPRGTETILLVEDEDAVRALGRRILLACGYLVLEASDGKEALDVARRYAGPIHLLVTDVVMPHLSGRELARAMQALRPATRVLFLSGYTDDDVLRHGIVESEVAFLAKPYAPAGLAQAVRRVLEEQRPVAGAAAG